MNLAALDEHAEATLVTIEQNVYFAGGEAYLWVIHFSRLLFGWEASTLGTIGKAPKPSPTEGH